MNPHTGAIYIDDVAVYEMPDGLNKVNIKNPSFETAGDAEHPNADWMMIESSQGVIGASAAAATGIPVTRETGGYAHSGNAYAKMNDTSPTYSMNLAQLVPVTSGKLYVATAYLNEVLTSAPSYGNDTYLTMGFFGNDFSTTPEGVIKHIGISRTPFDVYKSMGGWTQTQAMAVAPEGATQVSIAITSMTAHTGAIYIDDVGLYEASTGLSILAKSADLTSAEAQPSKITYQFRGSTNNSSWSNWSQPQTPSSPIALSGLISGDSKYLQAKMNLSSSNNEQTPAINSFSVNYNTTGTAGSSLAGSVGSLVASGSVLWVNILIALVISGAIMWFLLRRKTT